MFSNILFLLSLQLRKSTNKENSEINKDKEVLKVEEEVEVEEEDDE